MNLIFYCKSNFKKNNKKENINFAAFLSGCFLITEVCSNAIRNKLGGLSSKKMYVTKNNLTNGVNFQYQLAQFTYF